MAYIIVEFLVKEKMMSIRSIDIRHIFLT